MSSAAAALNGLLILGVIGLLLLGYPVAFTLGGTALLVAGLGVALGVFDLAFLGALAPRIYGILTNEALIAVPLFVFMGVMLEKSKVAEDLLETMGGLFGAMRGGLGLSVTFVGALLAASTGIVGATVVTMGLLSLPTMLRWGYAPWLACGAIAAAGTLGQIIPPSIVLVFLGDILSAAYQKAQLDQGNFAPATVSVGDLFAGALIPGLALAGLYMAWQALVAALWPATSPAIPSGHRPSARRVLAALVPPVVLIVAVLGSILGGVATPTEAAAVGAVGTLLLAGSRGEGPGWPLWLAWLALAALVVLVSVVDLRVGRSHVTLVEGAAIGAAVLLVAAAAAGLGVALRRTLRSGVLGEVVRATTLINAMIFSILVGATLFSLVFRGLGGDLWSASLLESLPGGTAAAVLVVMLVMFLLGFHLEFLEIIVIVVPIAAPILLKMTMADGTPMSPVWLGVMMAVNLQTSFLTPPVGVSLFYLRGVAPPTVKTKDIYLGVIPFVLIQLAMLAVLWEVPALATWLPDRLYGP